MSLTKLYKMLFAALLGITLLAAVSLNPRPVSAAGTLPLAMAQQVDVNGQPLAGCLVNFFIAGTVASPQNSYSDFGLTQNPNNQLQCDQTGRVPMFWLADGLVHVRMTDANGVPVIDTTMQVLGPSSGGGGGGGTVDPTTVMATGDMKARYGTGPLAGFVRANGLTIGNASCGCSERANADTQALFVYLYTTDPSLAVSGGRTGNALNDYNANKQMSLPDWRGRALAFLDDMGNSGAGRLTASYFGANGTVLGAAGGSEQQTLTLAQTPTGITSAQNGLTVSVTSANNVVQNGSATQPATPGGAAVAFTTTPPIQGTLTSTGTVNVATTSNNTGGQPHPNVQPTMLASVYLKL